jgi:hypothetical protein
MFIAREELELTSEEANGCFGRPFSLGDDYSLCALFRAVVINHEENPKAEDMLVKRNYHDHASEVADYFIGNDLIPLRIIHFGGSLDDARTGIKQTIDAINEVNNGNMPHWVTFDGESTNGTPLYLNKYLSQFAKTLVYIAPDKKAIILLFDAKASDEAKQSLAQAFGSMLWAIMPWYYPEKDEETIAFFKKLSVEKKQTQASLDRAINALKEYVKKAAEKVNLRDLKLHSLLDGIADKARQNQIASLESQYEDKANRIRRYMEELDQLYESIETVKLTLNGLKNMPAKQDDYIFNFFHTHRNITVIGFDSTGESLKYGVTDTLEFYDHDELAKLFDNEDGWVRRFYSENDICYFKELLLNQRGIVKINAVFQLRDMRFVRPIRGETIDRSALPNQHIYQYGCNGGNDKYYAGYADSGDWDLGVEQSISATKNWAVGDSLVSQRMLEWIVRSSTQFIYVSDGSPIERVTPEMKLVSFNEFKTLVDNKIKEEQSANEEAPAEGENNG